MTSTQMESAVQFLKHRLRTDHSTFIGHATQHNQIKELISRTSERGESNSALVIGPIGCGKTTVSNRRCTRFRTIKFSILFNSFSFSSQMISSILSHLLPDHDFRANTLIVQLNGYVHTDDAAALKSITRQMQLETAVDGKVFTTFADNLAFLLDCLKAGNSAKSKSVIYILEEFDLFCAHAKQTLIYNLFDVAQSKQAPICVIGLTRRHDVIEMLEKRVKSRFSHRQIFLSNEYDDYDDFVKIFSDLLKLPKLEVWRRPNDPPQTHYMLIKQTKNSFSFQEMLNADYIERKKYSKASTLPLLRNDFDMTEYQNSFKRDFITKWNKEVNAMASNKAFKAALEWLFDKTDSFAVLKNFVFRIVAGIDGLHEDRPTISAAKLANSVQRCVEDSYVHFDGKIELMCDLSILEFSLIVAMKHHSEIYDSDPFNFEIILTRLHKFHNSGDYAMENYDREVVLKAFDVLKVRIITFTRVQLREGRGGEIAWEGM